MWQYVIIGILCLAAASNALLACARTENSNTTLFPGETCQGKWWQPKKGSNRDLNDSIFEFVDVTLRGILRNETGPLPLEPLVIDTPINVKLGEGGETYEPLKLNLTDIVIANLSAYVVDSGSLNISGLQIRVAVHFPDITLTGKYDMDGWLGDQLLYLFGNGNITFSLLNTSLLVELGADAPTGTIEIYCIALDYNIGGGKANLTGLLGDEELAEIFSEVLADALPTIINLPKAKDALLGAASCFLKNKANELFLDNGTTLNNVLCAVAGGIWCIGSK